MRLFQWLSDPNHLQGLEPPGRAAHFLSELNAIPLFRERNGRAQTTFLALIAAEAGDPLDFERLELVAWMQAMIISFYNGTDAPPAQD